MKKERNRKALPAILYLYATQYLDTKIAIYFTKEKGMNFM